MTIIVLLVDLSPCVRYDRFEITNTIDGCSIMTILIKKRLFPIIYSTFLPFESCPSLTLILIIYLFHNECSLEELE
jgi:hypothetical protein